MSDIGLTWVNWSGRVTAPNIDLVHVRSEADAAAIAASAASSTTTDPALSSGQSPPPRQKRVRVAGSGHSHMPLVPNLDTIVDLSGLSGVISVEHLEGEQAGSPSDRAQGFESAAAIATVRAGTPLFALGAPLRAHGVALFNQGDIDRQTVGGVVATGTHGTGQGLGNFSSTVATARVALATGELVDCSATENPDLLAIAQLNLGGLGLVTRLGLNVRSSYKLSEGGFATSLDDVLPRFDELAAANRHFEIFWFPARDRAIVKLTNETGDEPVYPTGPEGSRTGWNYEVLPSHRTWRHTEMEYSVAASDGADCLAEVAKVVRRRFPDLAWPIEYRLVAADDVWLSPANGRATATISLHSDVEEDETELFRAAEEIFASYDGRPHWGKVNYLDGDDLALRHPDWAHWWEIRDHYDPAGVFLNDYLLRIRP